MHPTKNISRRRLLTDSLKTGIALSAAEFFHLSHVANAQPANAPPATSLKLQEKISGMLLGSLIGDAAGGPVEFKEPSAVKQVLPNVREWESGKTLDQQAIRTLASSFGLLSYKELRPKPEPYAHWTTAAEPGTVTDDTRHKIFLMNALQAAKRSGTMPISARQLAKEYVQFQDSALVKAHDGYAALCGEWLAEYNKAARWVLGERDSKRALPLTRLWGGIPTNAGQMALLPLAGIYPGEPTKAYRAAYSLGFMDNGTGKDMNAALVAGLAAALVVEAKPAHPGAAWATVWRAMKKTDPYSYGKVPWVQRSVRRWLDFALAAADRAQRNPRELFRIIEEESQSQTWWEAHVPFVSAFSILRFCEYDPLAALHLALDLGHDTDSTAQLLGAFVGAVHGPDIFPQAMRLQVSERFQADYDQSVSAWAALLAELSDRKRYPEVVRFL